MRSKKRKFKQINNKCSSKDICPNGHVCKKKGFFSKKRCRPTKEYLNKINSRKKILVLTNTLQKIKNLVKKDNIKIKNYYKKNKCGNLKMYNKTQYTKKCIRPLYIPIKNKKMKEVQQRKITRLLNLLQRKQNILGINKILIKNK